MVQIKRVYESFSRKDGYRVLVDRLWPRGIKKESLSLDAWFKELAPSTELRKMFGHDPKRWRAFQTKYKQELKSPEAAEKIRFLRDLAKKRTITLLYGARDPDHNNAVVLKDLIEKGLAH